MEDLKGQIIEKPSNYLDKVQNFCFGWEFNILKQRNEEIKAVEEQFPNFKQDLKLKVENFKEFEILGEGQDVSDYLKSILYGKIFSEPVNMGIGNKTLRNLLERELSTYVDEDLYKILECKYNTWKEEVIGNKWCKKINMKNSGDSYNYTGKKNYIKIEKNDNVKPNCAGVKNVKQMKVKVVKMCVNSDTL